MKIVVEKDQGAYSYFVELRKCWGNVELVGPYTKVPIITKEISNKYGHFYDLQVGIETFHVIIDHTGQEYLFVELQQEPITTYSGESSEEFTSSSAGVPNNVFSPPSRELVE